MGEGGQGGRVPAPRPWTFPGGLTAQVSWASSCILQSSLAPRGSSECNLSPQLPSKASHDVPCCPSGLFPLVPYLRELLASKPPDLCPPCSLSEMPFLLSFPSSIFLASGDSVQALPPLRSPPCSLSLASLGSLQGDETFPHLPLTSLSSQGHGGASLCISLPGPSWAMPRAGVQRDFPDE